MAAKKKKTTSKKKVTKKTVKKSNTTSKKGIEVKEKNIKAIVEETTKKKTSSKPKTTTKKTTSKKSTNIEKKTTSTPKKKVVKQKQEKKVPLKTEEIETKVDIEVIEEPKKEVNKTKKSKKVKIENDLSQTQIDLLSVTEEVKEELSKEEITPTDDIVEEPKKEVIEDIFPIEEVKKENKFIKVLKSIGKGFAWIFIVLFPTIFKYIWAFLKLIGRTIKKIFKRKPKEIKNENKKEEIKSDEILDKKSLRYFYELDKSDLELIRYRDTNPLLWIFVFLINRKRVLDFDMKKFKAKFKFGTLKDKILIIIMLLLILMFAGIVAFGVYIIVNAPEINTKELYASNSTTIYDSEGNEITKIGKNFRDKVTYDELPEVLVDAIVATEDSRFFQHNGVDLARFTKAAIGQVLGRSDAGGGSTITMQLSKKTASQDSTASGIKGIVRKFTDIYEAVFVFEKKYTKEDILEFYVNYNYLGGSAYGVQMASERYFSKDVSELTLTEAAMIAGLFQSPDAYDPTQHPVAAQRRRDQVLSLMYRHGYITKEECENAKKISIKSMLNTKGIRTSEYYHFVNTVVSEVKKRTGDDPWEVSMSIYTTMDRNKQNLVNGLMSGETYKYKNDKSQVGIAVLDVSNGALVAVGTNRQNQDKNWNYATSHRHPGSTAKPVIDYGPAIEYMGWGTGQTIVDDKMGYTSGGSIKNVDSSYDGVTTIKKALARSRNIPALFTFQQVQKNGYNDQQLEMIRNLGWSPEVNEENNVIYETCSLGGFDGVSPLESAAAYSAFARGGTYVEPYSFTKVIYNDTGDTFEVTPEKKQAMSEETAWLINNILTYAVSSGNVKAGTVSGTDVAGKTGTSSVAASIKKSLGIKGNVIRDSWINAYSPDYAISLWYGYPETTKEYHLTQSEGNSAKKAIMQKLTKGIMKTNSKFKKPSGIVSATIELGSDPLELATSATPDNLKSNEYFKKGTAPSTKSTRFAPLPAPSGLNYSADATSVNLTWKGIDTPDQINLEYLKQYFKSSKIYEKWYEKYAQKRLEENIGIFGNGYGYRVYITDAAGTRELGYTTQTSYTAPLSVYGSATYTVKASYPNYQANISSGISVEVKGANSSSGGSTPSPEEKPKANYSLTVATSTKTSEFVENYKNNGADSCVNLVKDGKGVNISAEKVSIIAKCYEGEGMIACDALDSNTTYRVIFTAYKDGEAIATLNMSTTP